VWRRVPPSINSALAYPGRFRGALEVRSRAITTGMMLAAAAASAEPGELVPSPLRTSLHAEGMRAVAERARAKGLAGTLPL
jgi:malate dehydrogenase (oxaloacetate-decarboxylating)